MDVPRLLAGPDRTEGESTADRSMYWCAECGMVFGRSSPSIDYAWCARCGADGVRELPWPNPP